MADAPLVLTETRGAALIVTLNRPEAKNALSPELVAALRPIFDEKGTSAATRGIVITGAGDDFCAGADLKVLQQLASRTEAENLEDSRRLADLFKAIHTGPKPVVAAVRGHALAGGAGLACVCDHVVAASDARFGFTEARIGFLAAIVARFLVDRAGSRVGRELLLSARRVEAEEARSLGLADELAPAADVVARAVAWIDSLKASSPQSIAATRRLLAELPGLQLDEGLDHAAQRNAQMRAQSDCREGVAAFLEKRKPRWLAGP